jgi:hypothetical protein
MNTLISTIKKTLRSNSGETIIEAIASLLILTILFTTVTSIIQTSLRWTGDALRDAEIMQNYLNDIAIENFPSVIDGHITFVLDLTSSNAPPISSAPITHPIELYPNGTIAFRP